MTITGRATEIDVVSSAAAKLTKMRTDRIAAILNSVLKLRSLCRTLFLKLVDFLLLPVIMNDCDTRVVF